MRMVGRSSTTHRKAALVASIQNITFEDQGVNWRVTFEWNNDQQTGTWTQFTALFPRDFDDIGGDDQETVLFELAAAVARNQGVPV